jgi:uroporphyrinogen-III synthase
MVDTAPMELPPLAGFTIGVTADRRAREQAELLRRRGARVLHGPTICTLPLESSDALRAATEALIAQPPDVLVATTGVGIRGWFAAAASHGLAHELLAALRPAQVLARGPKAAGAALTEGLEITWAAPTERSSELLAELSATDLAGRRVAVQLDGRGEPVLGNAVRALGASVVDVPVYRWTLPDDPEPAARLVAAACEHRLDAVTFTSAPAAENLLRIADDLGRADELRAALSGPVTAVCVGPVCREVAGSLGFGATIEPERARLGTMIAVLGHHLAGRSRRFDVDGVPVTLQGALAVVGDEEVELTERERAVLEVLAERPGAVVSKAALLARVWGPDAADEHAVEVTVGRLRRRLGPAGVAVETAVRRGYRLSADGEVSTPASVSATSLS